MAASTNVAMPLPPDDDRGPGLLGFVYVLFAFTSLVLSARVFVRVRLRNLGLDDYFMVLAWCLWIAAIIATTLYSINGGCRHIFYIYPPTVPSVLKYSFIAQAFGIITPAVGKLSIAAMIIRILGRSAVKWEKPILYGAMTVYLLMSFLAIIFTFVQCNPVDALWDKSVAQPKCWDSRVSTDFSIAQSSLGTFLDFALAIAPVPIIWSLKMSTKKKIGLCCLLGLGVFFSAGICAAIKTAKLTEFTSTTDFTWETFDIFMWAQAEVTLVLVCGSIPALKPLYDFVVKGTLLRPSGSRYQSGPSSYKLKPSSTYGTGDQSSRARSNYVAKVDSPDRDCLVEHPQRLGGLQEQGIKQTRSFRVETASQP